MRSYNSCFCHINERKQSEIHIGQLHAIELLNITHQSVSVYIPNYIV